MTLNFDIMNFTIQEVSQLNEGNNYGTKVLLTRKLLLSRLSTFLSEYFSSFPNNNGREKVD